METEHFTLDGEALYVIKIINYSLSNEWIENTNENVLSKVSGCDQEVASH
jgi:hypothetical protein